VVVADGAACDGAELGGCVVEPSEDGSVLLLERRIGKPQPHRYVIRSNDPEVV
jgi:hypothetical protein